MTSTNDGQVRLVGMVAGTGSGEQSMTDSLKHFG